LIPPPANGERRKDAMPLDADYHVDSFTALRIGLGPGIIEPRHVEAVFIRESALPI
jgi:hypothetical protein